MTTTFLGASANSSPKGSAVWTLAAGGGGAGVGAFSAVGASAGDLVSAGGGTGTADGAGLGTADGLAAGEAEGAGDCASAAAAKRNHGERDQGRTESADTVHFRYSPSTPPGGGMSPSAPARMVPFSNTQGPLSSHDRCVICPCVLGNAANIRHIRQAEFGKFHERAGQPRICQDERHRQRDRRGGSAQFQGRRDAGRRAGGRLACGRAL